MSFASCSGRLKARLAFSPEEPVAPGSLRLPEKSLLDWGIVVLLFLFSLLYLWPFRNCTALEADEGIVLQGAARILQGEVLYRDFFSYFTPGSYYWFALLFKIFGSSILVARTVLVVYGGLFSVLTYLLARRVCSRRISVFVVYLLLIACLPCDFIILHNWDSTLWAFLALYCSVWLIQAPHRAWALGTGFSIALTSLFEQSKGAGLMLGLFGGLLFIAASNRRRRFLRCSHLYALLAGLTGPILLAVSYFASQHCLSQMLADWFWPLGHYSGVNKLPYGYLTMHSQNWEALYGSASGAFRLLFIVVMSPYLLTLVVPFLALGFLAFHGLEMRSRKQTGKASSYYFLVSATIAGLVLSAWATGRPDAIHIMFMAPPLFLVLAWIVEGRGVRSRLLATVQPLLVVFLLISFAAFGLICLFGPWGAGHKLETRRGLLKTAVPDQVVQYLQEHVPPGEKIFVYPYQPLLYFLTATFNPTRYEYLQPGMHTPAQFQEAFSQLAADRTRVVLYDLTFSSEMYANWPAMPLGVLAQDREGLFIVSRYRACRGLGWKHRRFIFMVRKDLRCPGEAGLP